jgi:hypothetical protein
VGAADQISSEQVYEAVLSTKSRLSNPARRKSQSSSIDPHQRRRDTSSPSHVRIYVQNIEGSPGGYHKHDCTHPRKGLMRFPTALWCQSTSVVGGPQHQVCTMIRIPRKMGQYVIPSVCICTLAYHEGHMTRGENAPRTTAL